MESDPALIRDTIEERQSTLPSKNLALFGVVGLSAVFLASVLITPPDGAYFTICGFKTFTGLPCPGCGLTHSFCALGKGEVSSAFGFNILGPPLFLVLVILWIRSACVLLNKSGAVQRLDRIGWRLKLVRVFALGFIVYGIARIAYLVVFHPVVFQESPLSHLIVRLIH